MLSVDVLTQSKYILEILDQHKSLTNHLEEISKTNNRISVFFLNKNKEDFNNNDGDNRSKLLNTLIHQSKQINLSTLYLQSNSLINEIDKIHYDDIEISEDLKNFQEVHQDFLFDPTLPNAEKYILLSVKLVNKIELIRQVNKKIINNNQYLDDEENTFEIKLNGEVSLLEFSKKLKSIHLIYEEICLLTNTSSNTYPLKIIKIESGSLFAKVFGHSVVILLLTDFTSLGTDYIYKNFTETGKIEALSTKIDILDKAIDLNKKLIEHGININESHEAIRKSGVIIARELNNLIDGQSTIMINKEEHSISKENENKLALQSTQLKIELSKSDEKDH